MTPTPTTSDRNWLRTEVITGLQKLLCLRLDGAPSADMLRGTAAAWCDAITARKMYDQERDAPRIREAFRTLAATCERWPSPSRLLAAMPATTQGASARRLPSDESKRRAKQAEEQAMRDIAAALHMTPGDAA